MTPHDIRRVLCARVAYLSVRLETCGPSARGYIAAEHEALRTVLERLGMLDLERIEKERDKARARAARRPRSHDEAFALAEQMTDAMRVT